MGKLSRDELEEAEMTNCWECDCSLDDDNRFMLMEFNSESYYCRKCADTKMTKVWEEGIAK